MFGIIDRLSGVIFKALSDVLRSYITMILIIALALVRYESEFQLNAILFYGFLIYFISAGNIYLTTIRKVNPLSSIGGGNYLDNETSVGVKSSSEVVKNTIEDDALINIKNREKYNFKILQPILALGTTTIIVIVFMRNFILEYKVISFIFYIIIWSKGMKYRLEDEELNLYRKIFVLVTAILGILATIVLKLNYKNEYGNIVKLYFLPYVTASVICIIRMNLNEAYDDLRVNAVNKIRNLKIFNFISFLIVLAILILMLTNFLGVSKNSYVVNGFKFIVNVVQKLIFYIIYPIGIVMIKFFTRFKPKYGINNLNNKKNINNELNNQIDKTDEEILQETQKFIQNNVANRTINIIVWIVIIAVIVFILFKIYNTVIEKYTREHSMEGEEERDFVISFKDIKNAINIPFKDINKGLKELAFKKDLNIIRRLYIESLFKLNNMGYKYKNSYTPNEYIDFFIEKKRFSECGFNELTQYYNQVRYGKKQVNDEIILKSKKIKNNIDKIESSNDKNKNKCKGTKK